MNILGGILQIFGSRILIAIQTRGLYVNIRGAICKYSDRDY
jgi:hypothetical protein